jgi:hypothetical protein
MPGELFDSYGRPVIIPVAFDDSSGLTDNFGRPLVVVNAIPLSGGTLTGDLNIGANKIKTSHLTIIEDADGVTLDVMDSGANFRSLQGLNWVIANAGYMKTQDSDGRYFAFGARDSTVNMVEVGRVQGAADPYFRIGRDDAGMALNAVTDVLVIQGGAGTNNETAGFGAGIAFNIGNSASEVEKRAAIQCALDTATNGVEDTSITFSIMKNGALINRLCINKDANIFSGDGNFASGTYLCTYNYAPTAYQDTVAIGSKDISAGHRAVAFASEEAVVVSAAGASDAYIPILWNGVTYKLLLHT